MSNVAKILSTSTDWPADAIPEHWIESLFQKMTFTYGSKFADQWRGIDADGLKKYWAKELGKYTPDQLKAGVDKLKNRDWPPTLPEFEKMCRPLIDPMVAYYQAVNGVQARAKGEMGIWSHPAIYWAAIPMSFDLVSQTYAQIKNRWEAAYNEQMERSEWPDIPEPSLALPAPGRAQLSRENAAKMLDQLGASGVLKRSANDTLWYRKILDRIKNGDKTVTLIQRRFAEEAAAAHGYRC